MTKALFLLPLAFSILTGLAAELRLAVRAYPADDSGVFYLQLTVIGEPYRRHLLESSPDGRAWQPLGSWVWNETGRLVYGLFGDTRTSSQFFRVRLGERVIF
jgi:hypothetical protein